MPSETTDLERRVLAHERVLQTLIAYMSRTEPHFIDHLRKQFVEPMSMAIREHNYRDTDDYAEEFIRAVIRLGEVSATRAPQSETGIAHSRQERNAGLPAEHADKPAEPDRVQLTKRNGMWEVRVDGTFHGDYRQEEQALTEVALIRLSL